MMLIQVTAGGVLSFNVEPPPNGKRRYFIIGEVVSFRSDLDETDQKLVEEISAKIGPGPFEILRLGTRKHLLKNAHGQESWVPWPFLEQCKKDPVAAPG